MNCKPGDIAITTHPSLTTIVSVLHAAPADDFILPDGHRALRTSAGPAWVCEALGPPFPVKKYDRGVASQALRRYAVIPDCWLRPIRDNDGEDETLSWAGKPQPVEA